MPLARKPFLKFGQKPRDDLSANAATVECTLPIRTASNGIFARPINRMDDDAVQAALATVCAYVQRECRDGVLVQLRKQRQAANQRADRVRPEEHGFHSSARVQQAIGEDMAPFGVAGQLKS